MPVKRTTITLIGMAGSGKSTVGRVLAEISGRSFIDTDRLIEQSEGLPLQAVLDREGAAGFQRLEEKILLSIEQGRQVIATGGSSIYSARGMAHLKSLGPVVWLDVELDTLRRRVTDLGDRGLVNPDGVGFAELLAARLPLYEKWADYTIPAEKSPEAVAARIADLVA